MLYHTETLPWVASYPVQADTMILQLLTVCVLVGTVFLMEKLSPSQGTDWLCTPRASRGRADPGLPHQGSPFSIAQGLDFSPEIGCKGPETSCKTRKVGWDPVLIVFLSVRVCV